MLPITNLVWKVKHQKKQCSEEFFLNPRTPVASASSIIVPTKISLQRSTQHNECPFLRLLQAASIIVDVELSESLIACELSSTIITFWNSEADEFWLSSQNALHDVRSCTLVCEFWTNHALIDSQHWSIDSCWNIFHISPNIRWRWIASRRTRYIVADM